MLDTTLESCAPTRYFDGEFKQDVVKVLPGQYYAGTGEAAITTVLGSCVSTCLWDPLERIGGMNHFMLPGDLGGPSSWTASARFGVYAMELLINDMIRMGAARHRLVAKVFGGARLLSGVGAMDVGAKNCTFVLEFLQVEGIQVLAKDLQGVCPRKLYFFPDSGKVKVKRLHLPPNDPVQRREQEYLSKLSDSAGGGEIEIFSVPK
ncbi:MAG TPA: chemoreceptor glutamine deamidase CheD [Ramlibacter sp.]|jgi:chemotaxis protein CheD|nr:chemoreceptor glutamine deamidase CheD [Ramlibacter sp.]